MMGGRSGEHEVSVVSASSVIKALNKDKYDVVSIGITKTGQWISGPGTVESLKAGMSNQQLAEKILLPDPNHQSLVSLKPDGLAAETALDVVIPLIHGTYGEDGKLQGLLEMANLPYVGCGVLGSAVGMDKVIMKNLFRQAGLLTPDFVLVLKKDWLAGELEVLKTVAVEPSESAAMSNGPAGEHLIQGIGDGFIPDLVLKDMHLVDHIITIPSQDAVARMQRLSKELGLFVGISSGANVLAAEQYLHEHPTNDIVVTVLPDRRERYLSMEA